MAYHDSSIYQPKIKTRGFDPSPIAGNIPDYANAKLNPALVNTKAYIDFWDEQIHYCYHGYTTGGLYIPGRYYHYLNFRKIDGVSHGKIYPMFTDLHYDLFLWKEQVRKDTTKAGGLVPKARRKGLSFVEVEDIIYGLRFTPEYRASVSGGLETWVNMFKDKLYRTYNDGADEFKLNAIRRNDNEALFGVTEFTGSRWEELQWGTVLFRTMKDSATKLEGEFFHDAILEELGEFPLARKAITSIGPALKDGEDYIGKFWGLGTGGNMKKGGRTFSELFHDRDTLKLDVFYIPGKRFYMPYVRNSGRYKTPYLDKTYKDYAPEQLLGCEDVVAADESLRALVDEYIANNKRKELVEHMQNYPDKIEDIFISSGNNQFNTEKLQLRDFDLQSSMPKYSEYVLDLIKDDVGNNIIPLKVKERPATDKDPVWDKVLIMHGGLPMPHMKDLDIVGIDGYAIDTSNTSKSIGGIVVIRRSDKFFINNFPIVPMPILIYYQRPPRKEQFWDISLKISVFYNAIKNTMIGADVDALIGHYKNNFGKKYLSPRPKSFDSPDTKISHDFGFKATSSPNSKPKMIGCMQTFVEESCDHWVFRDLVLDFMSYDDESIGTDYDLADACGHALVRIQDMKIVPKDDTKVSYKDIFGLPEYILNGSGDIIVIEK